MSLFVFVASAQKQSLNVLHYNLFKKSKLSCREYRKQKEEELSVLLANSKITFFSILEDGTSGSFIRKEAFRGRVGFCLHEATTAFLQHSLYFDERKIKILQSQSYTSPNAIFFYYQFMLEGAREPAHMIVYKQSVMEHPVKQHQEILRFIDERKITGQLILLGGSKYPIRMLKESYITPTRSYTEFINLTSFLNLYSADYKFIWHDAVDFAYVSKDVWLPGEGGLTYARENRYSDKESIFSSTLQVTPQNRPIICSFLVNEEKHNDFYKTPDVQIVSQSKEELLFSIVWDEEIALNIEIVSMIGNRFLDKDVQYVGIKQEPLANISSYPTGIYLLKVSDAKGRMIIRKFTKY